LVLGSQPFFLLMSRNATLSQSAAPFKNGATAKLHTSKQRDDSLAEVQFLLGKTQPLSTPDPFTPARQRHFLLLSG